MTGAHTHAILPYIPFRQMDWNDQHCQDLHSPGSLIRNTENIQKQPIRFTAGLSTIKGNCVTPSKEGPLCSSCTPPRRVRCPDIGINRGNGIIVCGKHFEYYAVPILRRDILSLTTVVRVNAENLQRVKHLGQIRERGQQKNRNLFLGRFATQLNEIQVLREQNRNFENRFAEQQILIEQLQVAQQSQPSLPSPPPPSSADLSSYAGHHRCLRSRRVIFVDTPPPASMNSSSIGSSLLDALGFGICPEICQQDTFSPINLRRRIVPVFVPVPQHYIDLILLIGELLNQPMDDWIAQLILSLLTKAE